MLIETCLDIDSPDTKTQSTPLHLAAELGNSDCVRMLIEKGARVNAKDSSSSAPLHRTKDLSCAKLLVENKAGKKPLLRSFNVMLYLTCCMSKQGD